MISTNGGEPSRASSQVAPPPRRRLVGLHDRVGSAGPRRGQPSAAASSTRGQLRPRPRLRLHRGRHTGRVRLRTGQPHVSTSRSRTAPTSSSSTRAVNGHAAVGVLPRQGDLAEATADVITVAGAGQVLAPWTVDNRPVRHGRRHRAAGRPVAARTSRCTTPRPATRSRGVHRHQGRRHLPRAGLRRQAALSATTRDRRPASRPSSTSTRPPSRPPTRSPRRRPAPTSAPSSWPPAASIAGRVTSDAGRPARRVRVRGHRPQHSAVFSDYTDANGDYTIEGVDTGDHVVQSSDDPIGDYARRALQQRAAGPMQAATTRVAVAPGQAVVGIDAALAALPSTPPSPASTSAAPSATSSASIGVALRGPRVRRPGRRATA